MQISPFGKECLLRRCPFLTVRFKKKTIVVIYPTIRAWIQFFKKHQVACIWNRMESRIRVRIVSTRCFVSTGAVVVNFDKRSYFSGTKRSASIRSEIVSCFMTSFLWSFSSLERFICLPGTLAMKYLSKLTRGFLIW